MQTFLPYPDFAASAAVLDDRRLGKQRVETLQILRALHLVDYGWSRHPAVLMWRGHTPALVAYGLAVVDEWCARGRADSTRVNIAEFVRQPARTSPNACPDGPPWLGSPELHRSHRSALVRKDPAFYSPLFGDADPSLDYVWPDPPVEERPPPPFSAWAVRADSPSVLDAFRRRGLVGVPAELGRATARKQRRQHRAFVEAVRPDDHVVAFVDSHLQIGLVSGGDASRRYVTRQAMTTRAVTWLWEMTRGEMRRPYQLQNPSRLFALTGESWPSQVAARHRSGLD